MSASLVGSEMCIRDSLRSHPRHPCVHGPTLPMSCRSGGSPQGIRGTPVSYTHLTLPTICSV
eukprot:4900543-Alexandrium_andersonii.AAC.1